MRRRPRPVPARRALPAALLTALVAAALPAVPASATPAAPVDGWELVGPHAPRASARTVEATPSTFAVSSRGLDAGAQAAVGRATAVLAAALDSAVPVTVRVDAAPLPDGVLATAVPGTWAVRDRDGAYDRTDTLYPVALANALAGRDVDPGGADVVLTLSSTAPFSTTVEPAPAGAYDLTSVVLHELLPALGLTTTVRVDDVGLGRWGVPGDIPPLPVVADRLLVTAGSPDAAGSVPLLARVNGSRGLAEVLAGPVLWDGRAARAAGGGRRPVLADRPSGERTGPVALRPGLVPPGSPDRLLAPSLGLGETVRSLGPVTLGLLADTGWAVPSLPGARFTPVAPRRLLDTRSGLGQGGTRRLLGPGGVLDLQVAGGETGVPLDAVAVVLNVTGVAPSRSTDLRVYPSPRTPEPVPQVSSLNLGRGTTRANAVTVSPGRDGKVRLRNTAGTVSVLVDLQGFYATAGETLFHPRSPVRVLDTRTSRTRALGPGQVLDLQVAGVRGVPAGARAVVLGVTGVGATRPTDLRVYPAPADGAAVPVVSTVNLRPGPPVAGLAVVQVGRDGRVRLRNAAGRTAVLVDLSGWFDTVADGGLTFRPVAPHRVYDSRLTDAPRLLPGGVRDVAVGGRGGVPAGARAVVVGLTGIAPSRSTDVRAYPAPVYGGRSPVPTVSDLNLAAGQTSAGAAVVATGSYGRVRVRNQSGSIALAVDVTGWFGP